jgi:hypothetical protein
VNHLKVQDYHHSAPLKGDFVSCFHSLLEQLWEQAKHTSISDITGQIMSPKEQKKNLLTSYWPISQSNKTHVGTVSEEVAMRDWWPGLGIPAARLARRRAAAGVSREQGGGRDKVNLQLVYFSLAVQPL